MPVILTATMPVILTAAKPLMPVILSEAKNLSLTCRAARGSEAKPVILTAAKPVILTAVQCGVVCRSEAKNLSHP